MCPGWPPCRPGPRNQAGAHGVEVTQVIPTTAPEAQATSDLITHAAGHVIPRYTHGTTMRVYVGGLTATFADFAAVTAAKLPWLLAAIWASASCCSCWPSAACPSRRSRR